MDDCHMSQSDRHHYGPSRYHVALFSRASAERSFRKINRSFIFSDMCCSEKDRQSTVAVYLRRGRFICIFPHTLTIISQAGRSSGGQIFQEVDHPEKTRE